MAVELQVRDRIAVITLNRPEALNSVTPEMRADLRAAWQEVDSSEHIRVAVLTGAGEKSFCTGADLRGSTGPEPAFAIQSFGDVPSEHLQSGMDTDKPIICAINGYAIGGGLEMALRCDIRIAAEHAQFGLTEARIGSMPGSGGTQLLPRVIGRSMAMQLLLTGDRIDAAAALQWGLVSEVTAADGLMDRALELATRIAGNAPLAVRAIKHAVNRGLDSPLAVGLDVERYAFGLLRTTEDRKEGREAFQQKRTPEFGGR